MLEWVTVCPVLVLLAKGKARMFTISIVVFYLWWNNDATDNLETGISGGCGIINTIRYADDKVVVAKHHKMLQQLMDNLNKVTIVF